MQNKTCPECGAPVNNEAEVCPECGFIFSNEKSGANKAASAETKKPCNLLLEVPYRFDFNKGWKNVFDWFLSFGWIIGAALFVAGIIEYSVAGAKSADDPLEVLAKFADIKDAHDTVNKLVTVGLVVVLVQMIGCAAKDVYLKIFYGQWLSKRKEQAIETILKYEASTASAKENSFIASFVNSTYHACNPKENKPTAVEFFVYVAVYLFAMISTILLVRECVDLIEVKMLTNLSGKKFDVLDNLSLVRIIVFVIAWVACFLVRKLCEKNYENKYTEWAKQLGIPKDILHD